MILIEKTNRRGSLVFYNTEGMLVAKECIKCKDIFSLFELVRNKTIPDGYSPCCKLCNAKKTREAVKANPEKYAYKKRPPRKKVSLEERKARAKATSKKYYEKNKETIKANVRKYRIENLEIIKEKKQRYLKKIRTEAWWIERHQVKRKLGCKKWREKKSEYVKQYNKKYKTENAEFCDLISRRRISSKRARTPSWLTDEHKAQIDALNQKVKELNKIYGKRAYHLDHIIPLNGETVSGIHAPWNLQILTAKENSSKRNKFDGTYENDSWRAEI